MRPTRDLPIHSDIPLGPSLTSSCHVHPRLVPNQGAVSPAVRMVGQPCVGSSRGSSAPVSKVLIKVVNKGKNNAQSKTFTLRNVNVTSIDELRALIREQLGEEIVKGKFDIGYLEINNIRTEEDLCEIMDSLRGGVSLVLWCDGLEADELTVPTSTSTSSCHKKNPSHIDSDSDNGDVGTSKRKKSDDEVQKIVDGLKK